MKMPKENEADDKDLRDIVAEAMVETDAEDTTKDDGKARDESGKFVAKQGETEVEAAARLQPKDGKVPEEGEQKAPAATDDKVPAEGQQPEGQRLLTEDKAPRGWSPAAREKWTTIAPDIREEILRREEASAVGVRQLQERFAPVENFVRALDPYIVEAQQNGVAPEQYISSVMRSEKILRSAEVPARFQELLRIADQYGIPLRDVINESVGQKVLGPAPNTQQFQVPPELMQELQEMRAWRERTENGSIQNHIEAFANDKKNEFFEDVRLHMAGLIDSGQAQTLEEAYEAACWAVPSVRAVMLQRQGVQNNQKKAEGASLAPTGNLEDTVDDDKDEDLADTVRKAYLKSSTGRV
jgi:hypothetical protein